MKVADADWSQTMLVKSAPCHPTARMPPVVRWLGYKLADLVGCSSVQQCRDCRPCKEDRWYKTSWCVSPYVAAGPSHVHVSIEFTFCVAHRVPNK